MKKMLFGAVLLISVIILYQAFVGENVQDVTSNASEASVLKTKDQSNSLEDENTSQVDEGGPTSEVAQVNSSPTKSESKKQYLDYDENWCTVQQIPPENRALASIERDDWNESIGNYSIGDPRIRHYGDISTDALLQHVENENPLAMIYALNAVGDYSYSERNELGRQALVIGYTGDVIESLVMNEMAQVAGKHGAGDIEGAKKHLFTAFVYATYSAKLFDLNGYVRLMNSMDRRPYFETDLNPNIIFTDSEFKNIAEAANELNQWVSLQRAERGLPPIDREFSKTAKRDFDTKLGMIYSMEPVLMDNLNKKFGADFSKLQPTKCSDTYRTLFASD